MNCQIIDLILILDGKDFKKLWQTQEIIQMLMQNKKLILLLISSWKITRK